MQVQHYDCIIRCCAFLYHQFYLEIKRNPHGVWMEVWSAGQLRPQEGKAGGGGVLNNFFYSEVQPITLSYTLFD